MSMKTFLGGKQKCGRPKLVEKNIATPQLQQKRVELGVENVSSQLTGLFLLWSRKQINYEQFITGCYYEELYYRVHKSVGPMSSYRNSSLSKVHDAHIGGVKSKISSWTLNEKDSQILLNLQEITGFVHSDAVRIVSKILHSEGFQSACCTNILTCMELTIFQRCLDVISRYLSKNSVEIKQHKLYA